MRFEYKVITLKRSVWGGTPDKIDTRFQDELNKLGSVGWDLIDVVPYGHHMQCYLKREK